MCYYKLVFFQLFLYYTQKIYLWLSCCYLSNNCQQQYFHQHHHSLYLYSFNISRLLSGGITISSTFLEFISKLGIGFRIFSSSFFVSIFLLLLLFYGLLFLEAVVTGFTPIFVALSNNFFPYLQDGFLANDKDPYQLIYFLVLGSIE